VLCFDFKSPACTPKAGDHDHGQAPGLAILGLLVFQVHKDVCVGVAGLHPEAELRRAHNLAVLAERRAQEGEVAARAQVAVADWAREPDHGVVAREALHRHQQRMQPQVANFGCVMQIMAS
jgi:hypothetical protein